MEVAFRGREEKTMPLLLEPCWAGLLIASLFALGTEGAGSPREGGAGSPGGPISPAFGSVAELLFGLHGDEAKRREVNTGGDRQLRGRGRLLYILILTCVIGADGVSLAFQRWRRNAHY